MRCLPSIPGLLQLLLVAALCPSLPTALPKTEEWDAGGQHILHIPKGQRGAIASEAQQCSKIGGNIITEGGNAVDAVIATTLCVGVGAPYHSGIGGGGFMLVRDKSGNYEAIDFREEAPAAAHENMYKDNIKGSIHGGLSVGVPGEIRGLWYAHQKYGQLPWKHLFRGALWQAQGFPLNQDYRNYIDKSINGSSDNFLVSDPSWAKDFVEEGRLKGEGQSIKRDRYRNTLKKIAENGPDAFYKGSIAEALVKTVQERNGTMTLKDLSNYKVKTRSVLRTTLNGFKINTVGAPSGGPILINVLNVLASFGKSVNTYKSHREWTPKFLDGFDDHWGPNNQKKPKSKLDPKKPHKYDRNNKRDTIWHRYVEALKFGYAARGKLGDPDFVEGVKEFEKALVDRKNADKVASLINSKETYPVEYYDPDRVYQTESHGTSHIVAADKEGMAVSLTTTVNLLFGSQIMCPETGIVLNNEMNDFSIPGVPNEFGFEPSEANFIRPGKRPLSSITPVIIEHQDGTFFAALGGAGGSRIISATTQVTWRITTEPVSIIDAIKEPRLHHQLMPNQLLVERDFPITSVRALEKIGHNITWVAPGMSIVEGVLRDYKGWFEAAPDGRQTNRGGETL